MKHYHKKEDNNEYNLDELTDIQNKVIRLYLTNKYNKGVIKKVNI